ncbi:hypothetical protein Ciccas_005664 [Cichlidogyrus casuarinus]|uniref:Oxalate:formate antiporter n=1 Tax=Cichlidogyrus casuarinus TaxID=1844966 RepID=A0ABD2QBN5_9PLAT
MIPYITSYLRDSGNEVFLSAVALAFQGFSMPLGGLFVRKVGFRITAILSCSIQSLGIILTYWTIKAGLIAVIFTYSVMMAIGFGLAYSVVLQLAVMWFPHKRGLVVGLIVGGFGAGSLIFSPIQYAFINPENKKVNNITQFFDDPDLLDRIPYVFLLCGGIIVVIQTIGCILLRQKPERKSVSPEHVIVYIIPDRLLMYYCLVQVSIKFGATLVNDDYYLTIVATMSAIFNAGGRICWGLIVDKLSFKLSIYLMLGLWCFSQITFPFLSKVSSINTVKALYALWVALLFFSFSGTFVLMPTATSKIFKPINMSIVYGFVFSAFVSLPHSFDFFYSPLEASVVLFCPST